MFKTFLKDNKTNSRLKAQLKRSALNATKMIIGVRLSKQDFLEREFQRLRATKAKVLSQVPSELISLMDGIQRRSPPDDLKAHHLIIATQMNAEICSL